MFIGMVNIVQAQTSSGSINPPLNSSILDQAIKRDFESTDYVKVTSIGGQILYEGQLSQSGTFNTPGIYFIQRIEKTSAGNVVNKVVRFAVQP